MHSRRIARARPGVIEGKAVVVDRRLGPASPAARRPEDAPASDGRQAQKPCFRPLPHMPDLVFQGNPRWPARPSRAPGAVAGVVMAGVAALAAWSAPGRPAGGGAPPQPSTPALPSATTAQGGAAPRDAKSDGITVKR